MFDAPSTVAFDADAPMMVMDTSALIGASEQALSLAAACGATWLEAAVTNPDGGKRHRGLRRRLADAGGPLHAGQNE